MNDERDASVSRLFEDVKTVDQCGRDLVLREAEAGGRGELAALERGRRYHPDGVVEDYQRAEFRRG